MVIKIDGIDGCGKTTIISSLYNKYIEQGKSVFVISEFAGKEYSNDTISKELRTFIEREENGLDELERETIFTLISRRTNLYLIPKLHKDYDIIITDRSELANYTYGLAINDDYCKLYDLILDQIDFENNIVFWLDTPIEICQTRIYERKKLSLNEKKGKLFFEKIISHFQKYSISGKIIRIDGNRTVEEITNDIFSRTQIINDNNST